MFTASNFTLKYKNKPVYCDINLLEVLDYRPVTGALTKNIKRFDSKFEFEVYKVLRFHFWKTEILTQYGLILKPKTSFSDQLTYCCDFALQREDEDLTPDYFVEAKGLMTSEALVKLKCLELTHPHVREKLIIVSREPTFYFGKKYPPSLSLQQFDNLCKGLF